MQFCPSAHSFDGPHSPTVSAKAEPAKIAADTNPKPVADLTYKTPQVTAGNATHPALGMQGPHTKVSFV
jgi:hypothetical protein